MENALDHLKIAEKKQESLYELFDQMKAMASASLLFSLQWSDIQSHFDLAKSGLMKHAEEIGLQEKTVLEMKELVEERDKKVRTKLKRYDECQKDIPVKEEQLKFLKASISECDVELSSKEKQLTSVRKELGQCSKELLSKIEQLGDVQKKLQECNEDIDVRKKNLGLVEKLVTELTNYLFLKERELSSVKSSFEECCKGIQVKSEQLESNRKEAEKLGKLVTDHSSELELKEKELEKVKKSIADCNSEFESMEKQRKLLQEEYCCERDLNMKNLTGIQMSIEEHEEELTLKTKKLDEAQMLIEERLKQVDLKEKEEELTLIQLEIEDSNWKLQLKTEEVGKKEKDLEKLRNLIGESKIDLELRKRKLKMLDTFCNEIDSKKKELDGIEKSLQESKEQLDLKQTKHNEIEKLIDLKQKHLDSIRVLIQESTTDLEAKEKLINQHSRELDMKLREFLLVDKSIKARSEDLQKKERELNAITMSIEDQSVLFRSKEKELASLQVSIEECKKGLEALNEQGSSIQFPTSAPTSQSAGNLPGTSFVSEQVKIERPEPIMDPANPVSSNDQSDDATIAPLLTDYFVPGHDLMDHDVLAAVQLSEEQPDFVLGLMLEYYSEPTGFGECVMRNIVLLLEQLMKVSPTITPQLKKEASKLALAWKTKIRLTTGYMIEVLAFLLFLAVYGLASYFGRDEILKFAGAVAHQKQAPEICQALGFADKIDEFIKNLDMRKQYIEAARFSCAFGLINKFPPEDFFEKHTRDAIVDTMKSSNARHSPEAKCKTIDRQIAAMKSILECVADYKINARFLISNITKRIAEMEKEKEKLQAPAPPMVRPREDSPSFRNQGERQDRNKRRR